MRLRFPGRRRVLPKTVLTIYLAVLVISPLLFGAVHTYAYTLMAIAVLSAHFLWVSCQIRNSFQGGRLRFIFPASNFNILFFSLLLCFFFQIIPMPAPVVKLVSPEAWQVIQKALPLTNVFPSEIAADNWFALAPYAHPVKLSIIRWTVYGLFFLGLIQVLDSRQRIEMTVFVILAVGCFEALYGLFQTYSGYEKIWWWEKQFYRTSVTGTYINRNHFAGLMEMIVMVAGAWAAAISVKRKKRQTVHQRKRRIRVEIARVLSRERYGKSLLIVFAGLVMGIGLVFSASRAGLISAAGGFFCMGLFFCLKQGFRSRGLIIVFLVLLIAIYAVRIGIGKPVSRFESVEDSLETRNRMTRRTYAIFDDYKLFGIGAGNFQHVYPTYQSAQDKNVCIKHAHNDWVQFLAETGAAGALLLVLGCIIYLYRTIKLWRKRQDPLAVCMGVAPLAALSAMAIHSYFDFNLHIPANMLMLTAIAAVGHSVLHLQHNSLRSQTFTRYYSIAHKFPAVCGALTLLGLIILTSVASLRHFAAESYCNTVQNSTLNRKQSPSADAIKTAIALDGGNAAYWFKLAKELRRIRKSGATVPMFWDNKKDAQLSAEIVTVLEKAIYLNPFNALHHLILGFECARFGKINGEYGRWLAKADRAMERAAFFAGEANPRLHMHLGNYWIMRSETALGSKAEAELARERAFRHYRKARNLDKSKGFKQEIIDYVRSFHPDPAIVSNALTSGKNIQNDE
jgi:O-antigen ligase